MIEFGNAAKAYRSVVPPRSTEALRDLTLTAGRGEVFGVAGPNGAGKTTMLGLLLGFLRPNAGRVTVDGIRPREYVERHGAVYVPEIVSMPNWWTVTGALRRLAVLAGVPAQERAARVEAVIAMLGLGEHRGKRVKQLSKGNVQRLGIAQAMLRPVDLVVFDEPTHGLDPLWTQRFRGIVDGLRSERRAIVIASHNLDELERLADRVAILDRGRLTQIAVSHHAPSSEYAQYVLVLGDDHPAVHEAFPGAQRIDQRRDVAYHVLGTVPELNERLGRLIAGGARVRAFFPARSRLEAAFREAIGEERS